MSSQQGTYRVVSQTHVNQWDEQLQRVVPGWEVRALSLASGVVTPVFVPDSQWSEENADLLIRQALATADAVSRLGG